MRRIKNANAHDTGSDELNRALDDLQLFHVEQALDMGWSAEGLGGEEEQIGILARVNRVLDAAGRPPRRNEQEA